MADLQIVYIQESVPVSKVTPVPNSPVPAVYVYGRNMDTATTVLINGLESPAFAMVGERMIAEIPTSIVGDLVRSVAVLSNRNRVNERSVLSFRFGGRLSKARGILRLVQRFVTMLLTTPGNDLYHSERGGGILRIIARPIARTDSIQMTVQQCISKAETDLRAIQSKNPSLRQDEQLVSASLEGVSFDQRTTTLAVRIRVISAAGTSAVASLFA